MDYDPNIHDRGAHNRIDQLEKALAEYHQDLDSTLYSLERKSVYLNAVLLQICSAAFAMMLGYAAHKYIGSDWITGIAGFIGFVAAPMLMYGAWEKLAPKTARMNWSWYKH